MDFLFDGADAGAGGGGNLGKAAAFDFHQDENFALACGKLCQQLLELKGKFRWGNGKMLVEGDFVAAGGLAIAAAADVAGDGIDPGEEHFAGTPGVAAAVDLEPGFLDEFFRVEIGFAEDGAQTRGYFAHEILEGVGVATLVKAHVVFEGGVAAGGFQEHSVLVRQLRREAGKVTAVEAVSGDNVGYGDCAGTGKLDPSGSIEDGADAGEEACVCVSRLSGDGGADAAQVFNRDRCEAD